MADQARQKRTGKYFSFSGASRKDSVKALRLSRSLNLKRSTARVSKRQVGTELSDPFKLPRELRKTSYSFLCLFLNILWTKASEVVWTPLPSVLLVFSGLLISVCYLCVCSLLTQMSKLCLPNNTCHVTRRFQFLRCDLPNRTLRDIYLCYQNILQRGLDNFYMQQNAEIQ